MLASNLKLKIAAIAAITLGLTACGSNNANLGANGLGYGAGVVPGSTLASGSVGFTVQGAYNPPNPYYPYYSQSPNSTFLVGGAVPAVYPYFNANTYGSAVITPYSTAYTNGVYPTLPGGYTGSLLQKTGTNGNITISFNGSVMTGVMAINPTTLQSQLNNPYSYMGGFSSLTASPYLGSISTLSASTIGIIAVCDSVINGQASGLAQAAVYLYQGGVPIGPIVF